MTSWLANISLSDWFILLRTLIGATISGFVGILIARYQKRLADKESHLTEHQENMKIIEGLLKQTRMQITQNIDFASGVFLRPKGYRVDEGYWKAFHPMEMKLLMVTSKGIEPREEVKAKLYSDM